MIVIDFETNTSAIGDVIEVAIYKLSPIKENGKFKIIDKFHRYYQSAFPINFYALDVHNLSPKVLEEKRVGVSYPKYFLEDKEFEEFCESSDTIIAHNLSFELRHIDNRSSFLNHVCTMKDNKQTVQALNAKGKVKSPNLGEACFYFNVPFDEEGHHSAIYDIEKTLEILNHMR